jgi:hypothetical protein
VSSLVDEAETFEVRTNAWLRRPRRIRGFVALWSGLALASVAMSVPLALGSGENEGTAGAVAVAAVFALVFSVPCLLVARAIGRAGLWLGPEGIVVRGPLRTWRIPGAEAVEFSPGVQPSYGNGTPCPILTRADGSTVGVWALGREGVVWHFDEYVFELEPLCDELNALLEELYPEHPLPAFQLAPGPLR